MAELMRALGEATGASRAYVFENVPGEGAEPFALLRAAWSTGDMPMLDDPRLGHLRPAPHFPRWAELLAAGEALSGHVRELPNDEREPLELVDALSVVAVPVFVDGAWWGFIGFEDCEHEARLERGGDRRTARRSGPCRGGAQARAGRARPAPPRRDAAGGQPRAGVLVADRAGGTRRTTSRAARESRPGRAAPICSRAGFARTARGSRASASSGSRRGSPGARQPADAGHVLRRGRAGARGASSESATRCSPARCATCPPGSGRVRARRADRGRDRRPIFVERRVVGAHRLRRLRNRADVEPGRDGRSADGLEPDRRRDRREHSEASCASRSRSCAPSSRWRSTRSSSPTTTAATSTSIPRRASTTASPSAT